MEHPEAARAAPALAERDPHVELKSGDRLNETLTSDLPTVQAGDGSKIATCKNPAVAAKPLTNVGSALTRSTFSMSRLADFASKEQLELQTGHATVWWPNVILKELVDNALDETERAGVEPKIAIVVTAESISVSDNGGGMPPKVVEQTLDYATKTSSNAAYVSPTRGQQSNALQTLLAMGHALTGEPGVTQIESRGVRHSITFAVDPISREPRLDHQTKAVDAAAGTKITVFLPVSQGDLSRLFYVGVDFGAVNPHLALSFTAPDRALSFVRRATSPGWRKWKPTDPTCPHWYDLASLKTLIAAEINKANRDRVPQRTVADFIAEFRGLAGTAKRRDICEAVSASRSHLDGFFARGDGVVRRLLNEMKTAAKPVKARDLGVLGERHVLAIVGGGASARYKRTEVDVGDVPFLVECGFSHRAESNGRTMIAALNWSASVGGDPFGTLAGDGLGAVLAEQRAGPEEPVAFFLHVVSPRLTFLDRGKSEVYLPPEVDGAVVAAVRQVTAAWARQRKAEERDRSARLRRADAMDASTKPMSIKAAAWGVMAAAYTKASDNGKLPVEPDRYFTARGVKSCASPK
jgi:Histidine kinase-, DNA gyrase B-, and HSP90-like ATPase